MATVGATVKTLSDWAKEIDPDGKIALAVRMLSQKNAILDDMLFKEGNLPTGERITVDTALPSVAWRLMNQGVAKSKGTTAQIDEACGMLEGRSEIDKDLAELNGNVAAFRASEAYRFTESMSQEMSGTVFYGNGGTAPEEFTGLAPRYALTTAGNGSNILSAGGAGSDNSSVFLVDWGALTVHGIFPKGSTAGILHEDLGLGDAFDGSNNRFRAYMERWQWKCGIALRDWRSVVRIANIDISDLLGLATTQATTAATFLPKLMCRAIDRIPSPGGNMVFYANRTVMSSLRVAMMEKATNVLAPMEGFNQMGQRIMNGLSLLGVPIRICDQLIRTEAVVS